jgi:hypothetical protein
MIGCRAPSNTHQLPSQLPRVPFTACTSGGVDALTVELPCRSPRVLVAAGQPSLANPSFRCVQHAEDTSAMGSQSGPTWIGSIRQSSGLCECFRS